MFGKTTVRSLMVAALVASALLAQADVFHMGGTINGGTWTGLASLQFVTVGNPGNAADPATGNLRFDRIHLPDGQVRRDDWAVHCQFLNAVAKQSDTYGLYIR